MASDRYYHKDGSFCLDGYCGQAHVAGMGALFRPAGCPDIRTLSTLLNALRSHVGPGTPITISYHPDADPGDGSGWSVEVGDRHTYGTARQALERAVGVSDAR